MKTIRILVLLTALGAQACNPVNFSSTTEPSDVYVNVHGTVTNVNGDATIQAIDTWLDDEKALSSPAAGVASSYFYSSFFQAGHGTHRLAIKVSQNVGTATYQATDVVVELRQSTGLFGWKALVTKSLPAKSATLGATNEIDYDFQL